MYCVAHFHSLLAAESEATLFSSVVAYVVSAALGGDSGVNTGCVLALSGRQPPNSFWPRTILLQAHLPICLCVLFRGLACDSGP